MRENLYEKERVSNTRIKIDELYNIVDSFNLELNDYIEVLFTSGLDKEILIILNK